MRFRKFLLLVCLTLPVCAIAQKNELGVLVGGYVPIGSSLDFSPGIAVEGAFAHRLVSIPLVALYGELPVVVGFNVGAANPFTSQNYSSLFITPGLKVKLAPSFPVSPYLAVGVGYGRFHASNPLTGSATDNHAVVDIGGGLDLKVLPYISLRGEVRDFESGSTTLLGLVGISGHNLVGAGGLVLRF